MKPISASCGAGPLHMKSLSRRAHDPGSARSGRSRADTENRLPESLSLEVQQLRERVNHLAIEVFRLTTQVDELRTGQPAPGRPTALVSTAAQVEPSPSAPATTIDPTDGGAAGLDLFASEGHDPESGGPARRVARSRARALVETGVESGLAPFRRLVDRKTARNAGRAVVGMVLGLGLVQVSNHSVSVDQAPMSSVAPSARRGGASPFSPSGIRHDPEETAASHRLEEPGASMTAVRDGRRVAASPELLVSRYGVGSDVVGRELAGQADTFAVGRQVVFWTHITGGQPGESVRHVWLHEGRLVSAVALPVGSSSWRTQSRQTLTEGSEGDWVVEARDADDRVLARQRFRCES